MIGGNEPRQEQIMTKRAFVLMPFAAEFDAAYRMFIKDALEQAGFTTERADDLLNQRNIMHDIISSIANAGLIIADLTGSNPNVFYELGIAQCFREANYSTGPNGRGTPFRPSSL